MQFLTINILSAVGLFLGFFVSAAFIKLCNSSDLQIEMIYLASFNVQNDHQETQKYQISMLPFFFCFQCWRYKISFSYIVQCSIKKKQKPL